MGMVFDEGICRRWRNWTELLPSFIGAPRTSAIGAQQGSRTRITIVSRVGVCWPCEACQRNEAHGSHTPPTFIVANGRQPALYARRRVPTITP